MKKATPILLTLAALGPVSAPVLSATPPPPFSSQPAMGLLEERVARLERAAASQSASDLMLQLQQLQQEMQELRGLVETQQFELQKLQRQQRDQFMDIDARIGSAQPGASAPPLDGPPPAPEAATPASGGDASKPQATGAGTGGIGGLDLRAPVAAEPPPPVTAPTPSSPRAVGIPSLPAPETAEGNERDAYRDAFDLLKQRKYPQAVEAFNDVLRRYPQGQFNDSARYWLGESYYVQRDYPAALAEFDRLVQLNPTSSKVPGAILKIGYIQYDQEAFDQARAAFLQLVRKYPDSTEARLARSRLDRMQREHR